MNDIAPSGATTDWLAELRSRLALAFIVKDDAAFVLDMLQSAIPIAGFVSCIDTGSSDNTVALVAGFLAQSGTAFSIKSADFTRFDAMRNRAIEAVPKNHDWVLMLDADEVILEKDFREIYDLVSQNEVDAWMIPRFNWVDRISGERGKAYPDYQGRLFRNYTDSRIRYKYPVHEVLSGFTKKRDLPVQSEPLNERSGFHIHHCGFKKTNATRQERHLLYTKLNLRKQVLEKLWYGIEPFEDASAAVGREDFQGWRSDHPYLTSVVRKMRPKLIVEIGVWKGGSTITMAECLRKEEIPGLVISVDTWLGSWDHWKQQTWFNNLRMEEGYPTIYRTFVANVLKRNLQDFVIPLPNDSKNAAVIIKDKGLIPDIIHLDAAHDYESVLSDLRVWWPLLPVGGALIGDDYETSGSWPDVKRAFDDFFDSAQIESRGGKCLVFKTK